MSIISYDNPRIDNNLHQGTVGNRYVFYESQKEDYVCSKCGKVPQTLYCLDDEVICEQCKLMLPEARKLEEFIQKKLLRLKVVCPNRINGCNRGSNNPISLSELHDHCNVCEYEFVDCEFQDLGCKEKLLRIRIADHAASCKFRSNADVSFRLS